MGVQPLYCTDDFDSEGQQLYGFYAEGHLETQEFCELIFDEYDDYFNPTNLPQEEIDQLSINGGLTAIYPSSIQHKYGKWEKEYGNDPNSWFILLESDKPREGFIPITIIAFD